MTKATDDKIARLEESIARLEALTGETPVPSPGSVNPDGTPGPVAPGELIESAWGNAVSNTLTTHAGHIAGLDAEFARPHAWFAQTSASSGPYTNTAVDVPGLRVNTTMSVGVIYRATAFIASTSKALASAVTFEIVNETTGALHSQAFYFMEDGMSQALYATVIVAQLSGSNVFKVRIKSGAAGSVSVVGGAGMNSTLVVEEITYA